MTRIGIVAAWLMAAGIATALAWQVVGAADDQVSDAPLTPVIAVSTPDSSTATEPPATGTTTAGTTGTSTTETVSTAPSSTPTTTSSPSTTTSSSSTTTGIPATTTAVSDGGTVTVTGTDPLVELVAVVAAPGWSYEVTRNDDDRVEVRFENTSGNEIRIRCEWEDGKLVADIDD